MSDGPTDMWRKEQYEFEKIKMRLKPDIENLTTEQKLDIIREIVDSIRYPRTPR